MPPPEDGNEYLPFVDMISLEAIDSVTYRSKALPFSPGGAGRAYGGHVYAQAVWAAAQKVKSGFVVHVCDVLRKSYPTVPSCLWNAAPCLGLYVVVKKCFCGARGVQPESIFA